MAPTPLVIFHANCTDGYAAAWAAWKKFGNDAEYRAWSYDQAPPSADMLAGRDVFIVDFSFKSSVLYLMAGSARMITLLDHHATAKDDLQHLIDHPINNVFITFDMARSGAALSWDFFHNAGLNGDKPQLIWYVMDRDLWRWDLPHSKEINTIISRTPNTFEAFNELAFALDGSQRGDVVNRGAAMLSYEKALVTSLCSKATRLKVIIVENAIDGRSEIGVMIANTACLGSEVCHELLDKNPTATVAATYFDKVDVDGRDGKRVWSLRSRRDYDCSKLAKAMGGGGHPQACGFTTSIRDMFPHGFNV
jgi:oligoribonuclease NrnB/cAMP/cGMP phosphodiesterase (DHH superfamily)